MRGEARLGPITGITRRASDTSPGLTDAEADRIRELVGRNQIPERRPPSVIARFVVQFKDPLILLLLVAAALTIVLGDIQDLVVICTVVVLNSTIGVLQEIRAERALAALRAMTAPTARVWRNGEPVERPATALVPGDRIALAAGDIVPADAVVTDGDDLAVDESSLTGESVPVDKVVNDAVRAGSVVLRGHAAACVDATGPHSALGRIAVLLGQLRPRATPLQQRLRDLGRILAIAAVGLSTVVLISDVARGRHLSDAVLTAISLAVAAVPESLPAVVTLALALGARRMARAHAIVRNLPAVETLGSVTVLATDKTGTLTQGRMMVERVWVDGRQYAVTGRGYDPHGSIGIVPSSRWTRREGVGSSSADTGWTEPPQWQALLRDVVLCNDADVIPPDDDRPEWWVTGDTTEGALLTLAAKGGVVPTIERRRWPRVGETPFDSAARRMTTVHRGDEGCLAVCKGAPEVLLGDSGLVRETPDLPAARAAALELAEAGFRVLAIAEGRAATPGAAQRALRLVGLVGVTDPVRPDAGAVVDAVRAAGIGVVMVTGDHPSTARSVALRLGITADQVHNGGGLVTAADPGQSGAGRPSEGGAESVTATGVTVFARVLPEQKVDIVAALQRHGHVVAMTGDGVNDAPALRRADIGVALGRHGTEVAKQAADVVLTDDDLRTVVEAISEGRRIYTNIRRFLRYGLAGGLAEILVMLLGPVLGLAVPLLPAQILWINLLTHGLPGVAFGAEPGDPGAVRRAPRPPGESVLGGGLGRQVLVAGSIIAAVALSAVLLFDGTSSTARSGVFLVLGLAQLGVALALRQPRPWRAPIGFLDAAVLGAVCLQLAAIHLPPLADLLGTQALSWQRTGALALVSTIPGLLVLANRISGARTRRRARVV